MVGCHLLTVFGPAGLLHPVHNCPCMSLICKMGILCHEGLCICLIASSFYQRYVQWAHSLCLLVLRHRPLQTKILSDFVCDGVTGVFEVLFKRVTSALEQQACPLLNGGKD